MGRYFLTAWTVLTLGFVPLGSSASGIDVQIAPHSIINQASSSIVTVTVHNTGADTVYVPKSLSPFYTPGDHLMTQLFKVVDANGRDAPFTGRMVRVAPRDPDTFFFKIEPGQLMSQDIDLSADYDLSTAGIFHVSYTQGYTKTIRTDEQGEIDSDFDYQTSEEAEVWISSPTRVRR